MIGLISFAIVVALIFAVQRKNKASKTKASKHSTPEPVYDFSSSWTNKLIRNINNTHFIYEHTFKDRNDVEYKGVQCHFNYQLGQVICFMDGKRIQLTTDAELFVLAIIDFEVTETFKLDEPKWVTDAKATRPVLAETLGL